MTQAQEFTVFLASPSADTLDARQAVAEAVKAINLDPGYAPRVQLKLLRWDDPDRTLALSAETNGQVDVIEQVGHPAHCDLLIGLLRHRMGGKLPPERFPHPAGRAWHCTEWEIDQALQGKAQGSVRKVWIYRDVTDFPARTIHHSKDEWAEIDARHRALADYFERLNPDPETQRHSVNAYHGVPDLQRLIDTALRDWVMRQLGALTDPEQATTTPDSLSDDQQWLHQHLLADAPLPVDAAWRKRAALAAQAPATGWRSHLLRRYAAWCSGSGGQLDRRFVNLTLMVDRQPGVEGERFAVDARQRADGRYDDLAELLADQPDAGAWLLWGNPGCGKSTVLQHHELSTAQAALRAIAAGQRPAELCFWVRLSDYSSADADPATWLAQRWAAVAGPHLPPWPQACQQLRIRVLADGLNAYFSDRGRLFQSDRGR